MNFNILTLLFFCNFPFLCNIWPPLLIVQQQYDFLIVGAGSAGSVVASRLSENSKINVLLLEAGDCPPFASEIPALDFILMGTKYDWGYKTTPQQNTFLAYSNQQPPYPRGKVLGGTSTINTMAYVRGNKNDYDHWAQLGNTGWSYKEVLPYFLKAEGMTIAKFAKDKTYHNTKGPLTVSYASAQTKALNSFLEAGKAAGYKVQDLNAANQTGFMRHMLTQRDGARCSTAKAYLVPAQFRPNLHILCHSRVTKILFNKNKEAYGVEFINGGTHYTAKASKEVILSAGAFNSPQLLMLSGIGPEDQLKQFNIPIVANRPGVGENLQDHYGSISLYWKVNCSECAFAEEDFYNPLAILQWLIFGRGLLTISLGIEAIGNVNSQYANKSADWPDIQLLLVTALPSSYISGVFGVSEKQLEKYMKTIANSRSYSVSPFIMRPKSRGSVKLQSNSPFDNPLININYLSHPEDVKTIIAGMKMALEIGNSYSFKPLGAEFNPTAFPGCENHSFLSDEYLECLVRQMTIIYFHACGTCKMGLKNDPMAVVDKDLNVYGVKNLRVIDASIFPLIVSGNINAPTIMIGEKASDMIKLKHSI